MAIHSKSPLPFFKFTCLLSLIIIGLNVLWGKLLVENGPIPLDNYLLLWFRKAENFHQVIGPDWLLGVWQGLSWLGNTWPRIIVACAVVGGLLIKKRTGDGLFLSTLLLSGLALSSAIKYWINRPRPDVVVHFDYITNTSFPSGHALNSTLFYCGLLVILSHHTHRPVIRWFFLIVMLGLTVLTGVSRIALGVHYPTDVMAGWLIGAAWLWFCIGLRQHRQARLSPVV